jgi:hypothetical protein
MMERRFLKFAEGIELRNDYPSYFVRSFSCYVYLVITIWNFEIRFCATKYFASSSVLQTLALNVACTGMWLERGTYT